MGTQNGQNVPFLESASLEKRKRSVIKQFYKISKKTNVPNLDLGLERNGCERVKMGGKKKKK